MKFILIATDRDKFENWNILESRYKFKKFDIVDIYDNEYNHELNTLGEIEIDTLKQLIEFSNNFESIVIRNHEYDENKKVIEIYNSFRE